MPQDKSNSGRDKNSGNGIKALHHQRRILKSIEKEFDFELWVINASRRAGLLILKLKPPPRGIPDRLIFGRGKVAFVELKTPQRTGRLSETQKIWKKLIIEQNLPWFCIRNKKEMYDLLKKWDTI